MRFVGQSDGYVTVYDFNLTAVRKSLCPSSDRKGDSAGHRDDDLDSEDGYWDGRERWISAEDGGETVTKAVVHSRPFFKDVVKSNLPYRRFKTDLKMEVGQFVMINEDSVLLVKVCGI